MPWARRHASLRLSGRLAFLKCPNRRPRHFVPGYYQPVPPGQKPLTHRAPRIKLALMGRAPARSAAARPMIVSGAAPPMVDTLRRVRRCNGVACLAPSFAVSAMRARECRSYSALSIIAPSVNVPRRTRRKPSTIRGAPPEVVIGQIYGGSRGSASLP